MLNSLFGTPAAAPTSAPIAPSSTPASANAKDNDHNHDNNDGKRVKFSRGEHFKGFTFDHKPADEGKAKNACNSDHECIECIEHRAKLGNELTGYEAVKCLKDPAHSY